MKRKNESAITLIALIITIIIMLILAGVVINLTINDNGIFKIAKQTAKNYINVADYEQIQLGKLTNSINKIGENVTVPNATLVSQITANDYGKTINYSVTVKGTQVLDWKVFYNDGVSVYIIKSDYLDNNLIPSSTGIRKTGKYVTYWDGTSNKTASATLTNINNWSEFASGKGGKWATGGTTIEMFVESWNAKGYTKLYTATNSTGYCIGTVENPTTTNVSMSEHIVGYSDKLYFPHQSLYEGCNAYWLASPSALASIRVMCVGSNGSISGGTCNESTVYGLRPVVCLESEITGMVGNTVTID